MPVSEKTCGRCCLTKSASNFSKDKRGKYGLQFWCKDCTRKRHESNREADCEQMRQYHSNNREKVAERKRQYRSGGRAANKPWPDGPIDYRSAHCRVTAIHGPAADHPCIRCGGVARDWAYRGGCPREMTYVVSEAVLGGPMSHMAGKEVRYSPDPDRYDPMCRSCHTKRDRRGAE